ncbi:hypothetical protein ACJJIK_14190 [Microbulbifer sp. ZKSA006]
MKKELAKHGEDAIMRATSSKIGSELAGIQEAFKLRESPKKSRKKSLD